MRGAGLATRARAGWMATLRSGEGAAALCARICMRTKTVDLIPPDPHSPPIPPLRAAGRCCGRWGGRRRGRALARRRAVSDLPIPHTLPLSSLWLVAAARRVRVGVEGRIPSALPFPTLPCGLCARSDIAARDARVAQAAARILLRYLYTFLFSLLHLHPTPHTSGIYSLFTTTTILPPPLHTMTCSAFSLPMSACVHSPLSSLFPLTPASWSTTTLPTPQPPPLCSSLVLHPLPPFAFSPLALPTYTPTFTYSRSGHPTSPPLLPLSLFSVTHLLLPSIWSLH